MPSSSQQAELRRLMKLQLEKQKQQELEKKAAPPKSILKSKTSTPKQQPESGVASLLADDDSDSDGSAPEESNTPRVSWPQNDAQLQKTRIIESALPPPERKCARFAVQQQQQQQQEPAPSNDAKQVAAPINDDSLENDTKIRAKEIQVMDEFQALLDEADKTPADNNDEEPATRYDDDNTKIKAATDESTKEEDTSVDTREIEQASYEARIAKLRLKAAARARRKRKAAPPQAISVDTYTPQLAMTSGVDDDDDETDGKPTAAASNDSLTPLEILRQKRKAKAKQRAQEEQDS